MLFFPAVLFIGALVGIGVQGQEGESCKLTLQDDISVIEPLILEVSAEKQSRYVWPEVVGIKGVIRVAPDGELRLNCAGYMNTLITTQKQSASVTCKSGTLILDEDKQYPLNRTTTACSEVAESSVRKIDNTCGAGLGINVEIGFEVENGLWLPMISSCYDFTNCAVLYSEHKLHGESIKGHVVNQKMLVPFATGLDDFCPSIDPEELYNREKQIEIFGKILGQEVAAQYFVDENNDFLSRGHLTPRKDFVYLSGQKATYYYLNAAPQWAKFNNRNWALIEEYVVKLAAKVGRKLNVLTGTHGILALKDKTKQEQNLYLDYGEKRIPIPKAFWKLVQDPKTNKCTVVVGSNIPPLTSASAPDPICQNPFEKAPSGWTSLKYLKRVDHGYCYYCPYEEFQVVVEYAPTISCNGGVFEFPEKVTHH